MQIYVSEKDQIDDIKKWFGKYGAIIAFVIIFAFAVAPSVYSIYLSFTKYNIYLNRTPIF